MAVTPLHKLLLLSELLKRYFTVWGCRTVHPQILSANYIQVHREENDIFQFHHPLTVRGDSILNGNHITCTMDSTYFYLIVDKNLWKLFSLVSKFVWYHIRVSLLNPLSKVIENLSVNLLLPIKVPVIITSFASGGTWLLQEINSFRIKASSIVLVLMRTGESNILAGVVVRSSSMPGLH